MKKVLTIIIFELVVMAVACQNASQNLTSLSPSEVFKLQDEATRKKDVATIKQTLTKESLEMMTASAKKAGMTFDEFINKMPNNSAAATVEFRDEKIEGDTASVEVKNPLNNKWNPTYFRKEEGVWKVDMLKNMVPPTK